MDQQMLAVLRSLGPVSPDVEKRILACRQIRHFPKNALLIEAGQVNNKLFFIGKGIVRIYFVNKKGQQVTDQFLQEQQLIALSDSYLTQQPGIDFVEALEPCETLMMTFKDLEDIYEAFPSFERIGRKMTQHYSIFWRTQSRLIRAETVEERYARLMQVQPGLFLRVPLKHIASYLQTTPEHLSRIRSGLLPPR